MNLKAIATFLSGQGLGVMGQTLFIGEMPLECTRGTLLMDTYSGTAIDHELPGWRDTGFRVVVRSANYEDGEALAASVSSALTITSKTPMLNIVMRQSLPQNDPLPYRRSRAGPTWEFEVDVECIYIQL